MGKEKGFCLECSKEIEVQMCCSGFDCGCMGQPTEPPLCSDDCYEKYLARKARKKEASKEIKTIFKVDPEALKKALREVAESVRILGEALARIAMRKRKVIRVPRHVKRFPRSDKKYFSKRSLGYVAKRICAKYKYPVLLLGGASDCVEDFKRYYLTAPIPDFPSGGLAMKPITDENADMFRFNLKFDSNEDGQ